MKKIDLHGLTTARAIGKVKMAFRSAIENREYKLEIITGKGNYTLSDEVQELCEEQSYNFHHPNKNSGSIIVTIEPSGTGNIDLYEQDGEFDEEEIKEDVKYQPDFD